MYEPIIEGILDNLCHPFISKKDFNFLGAPYGEHFKKHPKLAKPVILRLGNFLGQLYELSSNNTPNWQTL